MPSLFLSHTGADKDFARKIAADLTQRGIQVWIDEAEIKVGESLIRKISEGIDSADFLAVILSPDSIKSEWVTQELEVALTRQINGKRIIVLPLLFRPTVLPPFLSTKLFADFTDEAKYDASLELLVGTIQPFRPLIRRAEEMIRCLPTPLITAFVARCARRMSPIYTAYLKTSDLAHSRAIHAAVEITDALAFRTDSKELAAIHSFLHYSEKPDDSMAAAMATRAESLIFACAMAADAARQAGSMQAKLAAKAIRATVKAAIASDSRVAARTAMLALDRFREIAPTSKDVMVVLNVHLKDLEDLCFASIRGEGSASIYAEPLWPTGEPNWIRNQS